MSIQNFTNGSEDKHNITTPILKRNSNSTKQEKIKKTSQILIDKAELNEIKNKNDYAIIPGSNMAVNVKKVAQKLFIKRSEIKNELKKDKIENKDLEALLANLEMDFIEQNFTMENEILNSEIENFEEDQIEQNFKLKPEEMKAIKQFYSDEKSKLEQLQSPVHIDKKENNLPRSLFYIPNGPREGMYVLLKTKGGMLEAGYGSYNRATFALHLETGEKKIYRSAKKKHVSEEEIAVNAKLQKYPEFYAAGTHANYIGSWRSRQGRKVGSSKPSIKERAVQKTGIIMDYIEGGELQNKNLSYSESIQMGQKIAVALKHLHSLKLTHLDLKPANIFVTKDNIPKIADFSFTKESGKVLKNYTCGTPLYMCPEIWKLRYAQNGNFNCDTKYDIWAFGAILGGLIHPENPPWWSCGNYCKNQNLEAFERKVDLILSNKNDPTHLDFIISKCLSINPDDRPSAEEIVDLFKNIA